MKPGDVYTTGDVITFTVTATDNVAVATIRLTIDGVTTPFAASPAVLSWTAPNVSGATPYTLDVEALDVAGNRSTASKTISVVPAGGGTFPTVSFSCPTAGAYLPSGYAAFLVTATATDSGGITKIEFFRPGDTTPFSTSTATGAPASFTGTSAAITVPTVVEDTVVRYRARAWNPSNNFTEVFVDVHVVPAVDIASATATDFAVLRSGPLALDTPRTFAGLIVLRGATLTHSVATGPGGETALTVTVNGPTYLECGGSIDTTGKGYPVGTTYPGATLGQYGSHIGLGGDPAGGASRTYGSVTEPREPGAGGGGPGGGVVRVVSSGSLVVDGQVNAKGGSYAAGGSIWLTSESFGGSGSIDASGGIQSSFAGGGGGAVAVEYGVPAGPVLPSMKAAGGVGDFFNAARDGGAGSVVTRVGGTPRGALSIATSALLQPTLLPSLGAGVAQPGSAGASLVTNLASTPSGYFVGHWVRVSTPAGVTKGTWRVGAIVGSVLTLTPNGTEAIDVQPDDNWQGTYQFESASYSSARVESGDPIQVSGPTEVRGTVITRAIDSQDLTIRTGATLQHPATAFGGLAEKLTIRLTGDLAIEPNAAIDVTGLGYRNNATYPGAVSPTGNVSASHIGEGGIVAGTPGSTYGSVLEPAEAGASYTSQGGGIVRVTASSVTFGATTSAIRANGSVGPNRGAGGSIWITTSTLSGDGAIEARGGEASGGIGGGGGAVAIEYGSSSGTALANATARGGNDQRFYSVVGGHGTVLRKSASAAFGSLTAAGLSPANTPTTLPSLGVGIAQAGTSGRTLVTDAAAAIPPYFVGHWVQLTSSAGIAKGLWRIGAINDRTVTLLLNLPDTTEPATAPGDTWQGAYRFDALTIATTLRSPDPIYAPGVSPPTGTIALAAGQAATVAPGSVVNLTLAGADAQWLTKFIVRATGPVAAGSTVQTVFTGTVATSTKTASVTLLSSATPGSTVTISGEAYDELQTATRIGSLTVTVGAALRSPAPFAIRSVSLCSDFGAPMRPGASFVACADLDARDVTLEISGAFEAHVAGYGNCRDPIAIPGSAKPGPLKIVATARDADGRSASAATRGLVVADERAPVLVSVEPSSSAALRSGDPLRVSVDAWDDVGIASVAITLGGRRTLLTEPPFEVRTLAPPVASNESLPVVVEVFDPSGNVSRRAIDLAVLPAGARLPLSAVDAPRSGVSLEGGALAVDGGWPWRDADGETRGRTLELPAIGTHSVLSVDGTIAVLDGPVARAAVHGGSVDVSRGGEFVGRFEILSVSEDGTVVRLAAGAPGRVQRGDFLEGVWSFAEVALTRGARLVSGDVVDAQRLRVDASSLFLSKKIRIPGSDPAPAECASRGARPDLPGTPPASAGGVAP